MKKVVRFSILAVVGIVCILSTLCLVDLYALDAASFETGKRKSEPIVLALEQYYKHQGIYPDDLTALVPEYLPSIPKPAWRYEYYYETCSSNNYYIIMFTLSKDADDSCGYVSSTDEWVCMDSIYPECLP